LFAVFNQQRAAAGAPPLREDAILTACARSLAQDQSDRNYRSFTRPGATTKAYDEPLAYGFVRANGTAIGPTNGTQRYLPGTTPGPSGQPSAGEEDSVAAATAPYLWRQIYAPNPNVSKHALDPQKTVCGIGAISRKTWDPTGRFTIIVAYFATPKQ
jgi:hypothetical protein